MSSGLMVIHRSIFMPLSVDSLNILDYIEQAVETCELVGYQREFLEAHRPNDT